MRPCYLSLYSTCENLSGNDACICYMTINSRGGYSLIRYLVSRYNTHMVRNALRVVFVLLLLLLAMVIPVISSGYFELKQASTSGSYIEMAEHYTSAAQRIPWRTELYELAGHAYYHAKEYSLADAAYQKAFESNVLSPEGWVAWGDVHYLNEDPQRASTVWAQALERQNPSDEL